jgi:hypothetical protein
VNDFLVGSVSDWQNFADAVLENPYLNAKMTADIDRGDVQTIIGIEDIPYKALT